MNTGITKYNFCTLFDYKYLSRGIALYNSLKEHAGNFHLFIFAFDSKCYDILLKLNLKNATIIPLSDFENEDLLRIKPTRTKAEYCWTSTSSTILYCLNNYEIDNCTYLDADLCFYSSLAPVFSEIGNASIALTEHHYTKQYDQSSTCGKYCVQFVFFRNDRHGLAALNWWKDACIDWCYARLEDGKFGDQKYLDDWTGRFNNVHIIKNIGAGVAPWNVQQYILPEDMSQSQRMFIKEKKEQFELIFYHFHSLNFENNKEQIEVEPSKFYLSERVQQLLYVPYLRKLKTIEDNFLGLQTDTELKIRFKEFSFLTKIYLPLHYILKNYEVFRAINRFFIKSSR